MITYLNKQLSSDMLATAIAELPAIDFKLTINKPTGNFFYDPWVIDPKFAGTVWDDILKMLPSNIGEARLIKLNKKECYAAHADIDNRWHVPLINGKSFLVDLHENQLWTLAVGHFYYMNAGVVHSAVNFGGEDRVQLVVRELLKDNKLMYPKRITIKPKVIKPNNRYEFDNVFSPALNSLNYDGFLSNFKADETSVTFDIEAQVTLPSHEDFEVLVVDSL